MSATNVYMYPQPRKEKNRMGFFPKLLMLGGAGWLVYEGIQLVRKDRASDEIILDLTSFEWSLATSLSGGIKIPLGVKFSIGFVATNPTAVELKFTEPFIRIYVKDATGQKKMIGHSAPSGKIITLRKVDSASITGSVIVSFLATAGILPDLLPYLWGRMNGEPSKQQLIVEWQYRAPINNLPTDGFEINDSKTVNL